MKNGGIFSKYFIEIIIHYPQRIFDVQNLEPVPQIPVEL
jgi:hypothetical protein